MRFKNGRIFALSICMKKIIATILLFVFSLNTFASSDISELLQNAEDFQFYHCETRNAENFLNHYVIDIRNEKSYILYGSNEEHKMTGKNLIRLQVLDSNLLTTTDENFDVSMKSIENPLFIGLIIKDTDGQYLEGKIVQNNQFTLLKCKDITTEK